MTEGLYGLKVSWNMRQTAALMRLAPERQAGILGDPVPSGAVGGLYGCGIGRHGGTFCICQVKALLICGEQQGSAGLDTAT